MPRKPASASRRRKTPVGGTRADVGAAAPPLVAEPLRAILDARGNDPFQVLGRHTEGESTVIRIFRPHTLSARIAETGAELTRIPGTDLFEWRGDAGELPPHYQIFWQDDRGYSGRHHDPFSFSPQLSDFDLHLFGQGRHWHAYRMLGARCVLVDGIAGVCFATWAPSAARVSVVGDFNDWDGRCHGMRLRGTTGVWELFIPGLGAGVCYKFEVRGATGDLCLKSDPYGANFEYRPANASVVVPESQYVWGDHAWISARGECGWRSGAVSIYEVHPGSWRRNPDGSVLGYRQLARQLVSYVTRLGFTHVELLPVSEYPLDESWGYQTTGYFAPTSRYGNADDLRWFVDHFHEHGIGVIFDWTPAHFPKDEHGLACFDGGPLYEHADPHRANHPDWGTCVFDYGRNEVKNFLLASAVYWIEEFHADGLRVDAVASMLDLSYSRRAGEWLPNRFGGPENLEAIEFCRELNSVIHANYPGVMVIAEESTSWPQVSRPVYLGGLGFTMKWNMGWMHDILNYMKLDPIFRSHHHNDLTFSPTYAFSENFVLPFSHDEVVHCKGTLLSRMPGDRWQQFANLRLLFTYMFTHPGKKLLFMGCELAQDSEWDFRKSLPWELLNDPMHAGVNKLVSDLNRLYRDQPALHCNDFEQHGFDWIDCHDAGNSVLAFMRRTEEGQVIVVLNFTPVVRHGYRVGVPELGDYQEIFNSDASVYCGSNQGNLGRVVAVPGLWMDRPGSVTLTLPPLAGIVLKSRGQ